MLIQGILLGLVAAACQSLCYVCTRIFLTKPGRRPVVLFGLSHAIMGFFAIVLLPFCFSPLVLRPSVYALPLALAVGAYMTGQMCLYQAMKWTDPSRVSPMLGLKIIVLTTIAVLFLSERVTPLQWLAVLLSVTAALGLNYAGGGIGARGGVAILGACLGYAVSDLSIVALTRALSPDGGARGILLGCSLSYILAGLIGFVFIAGGTREDRAAAQWKAALPVAVSWFIAMICLFACFRMIGAVFGNIVQSLRGPFSILMGIAIVAVGHVHLEQRVSRWVLARRVAASLLMCAAIGLFTYGRTTDRKPQAADVNATSQTP